MKRSAAGAALHLRAMLLFDEYLALKGFRRAYWLARLRLTETPGLTAAVDALVAADRSVDRRLEHGVPDFTLSNMRATEMADMVGRCLGPWKIENAIGYGRMGAVYRARHVGGRFRHACALKVVPIQSDETGVRDSLRESQEQLLRLNHPGIVALLDSGIEDETTPWFAMELVRGEPINVYCQRKKLTVKSRVRLMMAVVDSVSYAHGRRVIHQDIRPSNLMVTEKGKVKVLGFGLAALLAVRLMPRHSMAHYGVTVSLAAPEQVRGGPVTLGIDIYALGLVLHLLLCGRHAFGRATLAIGYLGDMAPSYVPGQMSRVARVMRPDEAAMWSSSPGLVARSLTGRLDAIVARCLEADPRGRYATADELRENLASWLH